MMLDCLRMKYGLRCAVTCKIRLAKPPKIAWDDLAVDLDVNEAGFLSSATVTASGLDALEYRSDYEIDNVQKVFRLQANRKEALHARMMSAIHSLESFLCFYGNLEAIHWSAAEVFLEAESEEEEQYLLLKGWTMTPAINDPVVDLSPEQLGFIIANAKTCSPLTTTLAFYRAGINEIRRANNISAFFNFYFVLEGLYGNGKWRGKDVIYEFGKSAIVVQALENIIAEGFPRAMGEDVSIADRLAKINKPCNPAGMIHFLVHTRGDLHHHSGLNGRAAGSPLVNEHYQALAQFSLRICQAVLLSSLKQMDPNVNWVQAERMNFVRAK